ncbi:MAG: hypothetical protein Q8907_03485 [Bacteroidota bacterium]|nr:hypothetical protein [Bacteroidota bacterium]
MEQNNLFGSVKEDLQKIDYFTEILINDPKVSEIELDIVLEKIRHLYDCLLDIKRSRKNHQPEMQTIPEPEIEKVEAPDPDPAPAPEFSEELEFETAPETQNIAPPVEKEVAPIQVENQSVQPPRKEEIVADSVRHTQTIKVEATSIAESLITKNTSLNDAFAKDRPAASNFSSTMQNTPISNLKSAIGVNDKFLFIRELFMGNADLYNQTIDILNNAANFNEAFNYVDSKFSWKRDNPVTQKLFELLRRKYISGRN